ncbi:MAG: GAF domain-containing sensor histidine kinase [Myxococcota bacterium]
MLDTIDRLSLIWDAERAAHIVLGTLRELTGAERAIAYLEPSPDHDALRVSVAGPAGSPRAVVGAFSRTVANRVLAGGEPVCLQRVDDDALISSAASVMAMNVCSILCVPVPLGARSAGGQAGPGGLVYLDSSVPVGGQFERALPVVSSLGRALGMAIDRIRSAERLRSQAEMVEIVAHELRSPLTAIVGFGELAELRQKPGDVLSGEVQMLIEVVKDQGQRMKRLIADVQSLGRAWRYSLDDARAVTPHALGQAAATEVQPAAHAAGVRIVNAIDPALTPVLADAARLHQVLVNLLTNAVRYAPPDSAIDIRAAPEPFEGQVGERPKLRFSVIDRGPGISVADASRIFQRFNRGSRPRGDGTGLGLSIAHAIVLAHGGDIWAVPGSDGATFHFTVPLASAGTEDEP